VSIARAGRDGFEVPRTDEEPQSRTTVGVTSVFSRNETWLVSIQRMNFQLRMSHFPFKARGHSAGGLLIDPSRVLTLSRVPCIGVRGWACVFPSRSSAYERKLSSVVRPDRLLTPDYAKCFGIGNKTTKGRSHLMGACDCGG